MAAGGDLDAAIAEKVMGWTALFQVDGNGLWAGLSDGSERPAYVPSYSTDIAAAWQVVENLRARGCEFSLSERATDESAWHCAFFPKGGSCGIGFGGTVPEVICIAALDAVEGENRE